MPDFWKSTPKQKAILLLLPLKIWPLTGKNVAVRKVLALGHDEYAIGTSLGLILFNGKNQKKILHQQRVGWKKPDSRLHYSTF